MTNISTYTNFYRWKIIEHRIKTKFIIVTIIFIGLSGVVYFLNITNGVKTNINLYFIFLMLFYKCTFPLKSSDGLLNNFVVKN